MKPVERQKLFLSVQELIEQAQQSVVRNINLIMVATHFQIGRMIVEDEQGGQTYAAYGTATIRKLSEHLTERFGRGYSVDNLELMRIFYLEYRKSESLIRISRAGHSNSESLIRNLAAEFSLSWTHYLRLLKVKDKDERKFYELEANVNNWSVRELQRQINSSFYERLVLSKDKEAVRKLAEEGQLPERSTDVLKSPFILEFLNLKEDNRYSENELENAIINKLEHFMLELGKGFLFEGRQRRITLEGDHFWVDLVFYNRLLNCFVLIDLKIGKLTHQDIGQMQMYVNYYDRKIRQAHEKPTLGIILCKEDNKAVVEFTLPLNNEQIFSREYKLYLPSKDELKKQLE
ncbi:MAG TPA: PDDEXK nuclease domain-containing protein [Mucilaginibacter sp.]|jgi:predicted nuclease of restriction endonuclease-like (RecB) superfamily|nr:PDDEXK nuclease domain-containing protein [Mucilaginibacter sp.]